MHRVDIIGSGRVAMHLIRIFTRTGIRVNKVYARSSKGAVLAENLGLSFDTLDRIPSSGPLMIMAISDDAIPAVASMIPDTRMIVHTSGSVGMDALPQPVRGVFYPLQTFTLASEPDWKQIPICLESNDDALFSELQSMARIISDKVYNVSSQQRQYLHIAAVFASNFSNQMYALADELLSAHGMDFELVRPLILETALKVQHMRPREAQTGPARRHDMHTINRHLGHLEKEEDLHELYQLITRSIIASYNGKL
ncbi:MAG: hypothetical protein RL226_39 [Bacteroidota bacterium]|jgi:predicted short-subunit dehydrogenase-like oxidoreductase (DUF2520 family)